MRRGLRVEQGGQFDEAGSCECSAVKNVQRSAGYPISR